jgi:hypothetical protein
VAKRRSPGRLPHRLADLHRQLSEPCQGCLQGRLRHGPQPGKRILSPGTLGRIVCEAIQPLHQRMANAEVATLRTVTAVKSVLAAAVETTGLVRRSAGGCAAPPEANLEAPAQAPGIAGHAAVRKRVDLRAQERRQLWGAALTAASGTASAGTAPAGTALASGTAPAAADSSSAGQSSGLAAVAVAEVELSQAGAAGPLVPVPVSSSATIRFLVVKGRKDGQKAVVQTEQVPFAMQPGWLVPGLLNADGKDWLWMAAWDKWMAPDGTIGSKLSV